MEFNVTAVIVGLGKPFVNSPLTQFLEENGIAFEDIAKVMVERFNSPWFATAYLQELQEDIRELMKYTYGHDLNAVLEELSYLFSMTETAVNMYRPKDPNHVLTIEISPYGHAVVEFV